MSAAPAGEEVLLVAVDASPSSDKAFAFAVRHAIRLGTQVHLVHVIPRNTPADEFEATVRKAEKLMLDRFLTKLPAQVAVAVNPMVHIIKAEEDLDDIGHSLLLKAEQLNAILVMASHKKSRAEVISKGSATQTVLRAHHETKTTIMFVPV
ncbi:MAG: hypothetical protein J3K34DRAFT_519405 [Monoraphidium minutum]|nr:MAG: hypothetical protein J3K34DRAFT_519405 [Monoraphidium minutum]